MSWEVIHGDSAEVLKGIASDSIDSIVTDPPAGIGFMGKEWDDFRRARNEADAGRDNVFGRTSAHGPQYGRARAGFIAMLTPIMRECLRVLKPGGHALVWALPRTSHWTMTAIDDAGFEVRDVVSHWFGSGFPKSLDVSKAIDQHLGAKREVVGVEKRSATRPNVPDQPGSKAYRLNGDTEITSPFTSEAARWQGFGTALKPACEFWILARKPLGSTVAECVLKHGTGAINVDACRVRTGPTETHNASTDSASQSYGGYAGVKDTRQSDGQKIGRWPANLLLSHSPGCVRRGTKRVASQNPEYVTPERGQIGFTKGGSGRTVNVGIGYASPDGTEIVEAWECVENCPVRLLDEQSEAAGVHGAGHQRDDQAGGTYDGSTGIGFGRIGIGMKGFRIGDNGSNASRFFPTFTPDPLDDVTPFFYCAKPSRAETEAGCDDLPERTAKDAVGRDPDSAGAHNPRAGSGRGAGATRYRCAACGKGLSGGGDDHGETSPCDATEDRQHVKVASGKGKAIRNTHPTKKSVSLMRWLVKLVTPPGGAVLDCFAGSGSTGIACVMEGFRFIGIERESEYVAIARARIERAVDVKTSAAVVEIRDEATGKRVEVKARQAELFAAPPIEIPQAVLCPPVAPRACVECGAEVDAGMKYRCRKCLEAR